MKRVMLVHEMLNGFEEIRQPHMLHPEADELWMPHGEVPDELWARYREALDALSRVTNEVHGALQPVSLSPSESEQVALEWKRVEAERAEQVASFRREVELAREACTHADVYGSLVIDGCCMLCGRHAP